MPSPSPSPIGSCTTKPPTQNPNPPLLSPAPRRPASPSTPSVTSSNNSHSIHHPHDTTAGHRPKHHHKPHFASTPGPARPVFSRTLSGKTVQKYNASSSHAKLTHRAPSPPPESPPQNHQLETPWHRAALATALGAAASTHRRSRSDVRLGPRAVSSTALRRHRSHVDVPARRNKSAEKLKHRTGNNGSPRLTVKPTKSQVHFEIGTGHHGDIDLDADEDAEEGDDDKLANQEDEWVDASADASSSFLSVKPGAATPEKTRGSLLAQGPSFLPPSPETAQAAPISRRVSTPDLETLHHKEYLTSRLLGRAPSGAPPKMSSETVSVVAAPPTIPGTSGTLSRNSSSLALDAARASGSPNEPGSGTSNNAKDGLTSRFLGHPSPGTANDSFYSRPRFRAGNGPRRPQSLVGLNKPRGLHRGISLSDDEHDPDDDDDDAPPTPSSTRTLPASAEKSRTQQKLNLQRASSVIDPAQAVAAGVTGVLGANPLVGVGAPGLDGTTSRDPRVSKLLERTGMEYLVVRRYQNPVARSLNRISAAATKDKSRPIPSRPATATTPRTPSIRNGTGPLGGANHRHRHSHTPNFVDPDRSRPTSRMGTFAIVRSETDARTPSSFDTDDERTRVEDRLSGSSTGTHDDIFEDDHAVQAILRNLWDRNMDLSASQD